MLRGLEREDLFTVVHEQFFTDTADYADILLPATNFLEHRDIQGAYGHYNVQLSQQSIDPPGQARSNVALFSALAQRLGFKEPCFRDTADQMIRQALGEGEHPHQDCRQPPWFRGITLERLEKEGHVRLQFESEVGPEHPLHSRPSPTAASARPAARLNFTQKASPPEASIRFRDSFHPRSRAIPRLPISPLRPFATRSSSCPARQTTT